MKFLKKLSLNKRTISILTDDESKMVVGGIKTGKGRTCGGASHDGASCECDTRSNNPEQNCSVQACNCGNVAFTDFE